jgi:hypothetical protein
VARSAGINDGQTPVAEADALPLTVDCGRSPHAFIVTPAMLDRFQHRTHERFGVLSY